MSKMMILDEEAKTSSLNLKEERQPQRRGSDKSINEFGEDGDFSSHKYDEKTMILQESLIDLYLSVKLRSNEEVGTHFTVNDLICRLINIPRNSCRRSELNCFKLN